MTGEPNMDRMVRENILMINTDPTAFKTEYDNLKNALAYMREVGGVWKFRPEVPKGNAVYMKNTIAHDNYEMKKVAVVGEKKDEKIISDKNKKRVITLAIAGISVGAIYFIYKSNKTHQKDNYRERRPSIIESIVHKHNESSSSSPRKAIRRRIIEEFETTDDVDEAYHEDGLDEMDIPGDMI